ncbi:MAG: response regulator, partial [Pseudomonadales bacterium]|nr:response regulator [Pseudomonadales bacterium]
ELAVKLKHNIGELNEQNQLLSASEEELKDQREELKASNEELEEKQQELQASNEDLVGQQQALSLESQKLQQSKSALEEKARELALASKYKSEFLANMSHELRTPLNSLLILSKSLYENKQGNLTTEQVEEADIVYQGGKTLLNLINDIMDLSKVEAGMLDVNIDSFDPTELVYNLEALFNPLAKQRQLEFNINVEQSITQVISTDRQRLEQILKNFLSNAFKFTEVGMIKLDIYPLVSAAEPGTTAELVCSHICFKVSDSGIGIPEDKQQAIFEAFQQADGSTSRKYGGTGLGLTISKELALLLGGVISMQSQEGKGSSFTLTLPVSYPQEGDELKSPVATIAQIDPQPVKQKLDHAEAEQLLNSGIQQITENSDWLDDDRMRINSQDRPLLVIEDNKVFSQILINLIRKLDMKVIATDKGRDGILLAIEYLPSGILLDLTLPDINGLKVLEQLKDNLQTRHIPVHVISGTEQKMQSLHLGASSYLQKPTDPEVISSTLLEMYEANSSNMKNILVVENDAGSAAQIGQSIAGTETQLSFADSAEQACLLLQQQKIDCIILDLDLPDLQGTELVKTISAQKGAKGVPIIVYTGRAITEEEYRILNKFSSSIVIKGAESPERLLDDVSLFLHHIGDKYSTAQQQALQMLHDENAMLKDRRVLVVDDDMRNVFAITRILEQAGIQVIQAENGKVAVDLLATHEQPIELILMDIMMPVMNGYEAIAHIRKMPDYRSVPIIALTAKAMPADRQLCIQAGASEYITKPLEMDKVLAMLRVWLYRRVETEYVN